MKLPKPKYLPQGPWIWTTTASPGKHVGKGFVYILDANGRKIGTVWGKPDEKVAIADLIIEARSKIED